MLPQCRHLRRLVIELRLTTYHSQARSYAAVIFRRIASKTRKTPTSETTDLFLSLSNEQAAVIRQKLLETLGLEPDRAVRNKISDAVAEIARQYSDTS